MFKEIKNIDNDINSFLSSLKKPNNEFSFYPVKNGLVTSGEKMNLGFSNYGLKILYILKIWDKVDLQIKNNWVNYLNSFQINLQGFPLNSYIDLNFLSEIYKNNIIDKSKYLTKDILNFFGSKQYKPKNVFIKESITAETKQTISTLNLIGSHANKKIHGFPSTNNEIYEYLVQLDWSKPWNAGAQFSNLALLICTQIESNNERNELINTLDGFLNECLLDIDTGAYFTNKNINNRELINGAMKILTAFEWTNSKIHFPEKLIDTCLKINPLSEGCDILDFVYVLYKCYKESEYKRDEIIKAFEEIYFFVQEHYFPEIGGFSYFKNKSQTYYYGVKISKGLNEPDLHGTLLFLWCYTMIYDLIEKDQEKFNILKP